MPALDALVPVLCSRWHGKALPKTPTHHCLVAHAPWQSSTYPLGKDTWHLHLGTGCTGPSMLPWGCRLPAQTRHISCKHSIHGPPVPLAQLEHSSKPEQMLQDITSDAGFSLADFREPLEVAWHDNYFQVAIKCAVMPPSHLQYNWDLLLSVSRHDDTFRDADAMRLKWWKRERKAGLCEGRSFLFPEVVHGLLPLRFSSENLTSVLRKDSADSSLSWKQDGGEVHWNLSPQKSCITEMFSPSWHGPRSDGQPIPAPSIQLAVSNGRPLWPVGVLVLVKGTHLFLA